jgi:hypothetical protein
MSESQVKLGMKIRHEYANGDRKVCRINKRTGYCRVYIIDGDRRNLLTYRLSEVLDLHYPIYSAEEIKKKWLSSN